MLEDIESSCIDITEMHFSRKDNVVKTEITFARNGNFTTILATGNGTLDAISNALKQFTGTSYKLQVYTEHSLHEKGSDSVAAAYIGILVESGKMCWGVGTDTDIIHAGAKALLSAFNNIA